MKKLILLALCGIVLVSCALGTGSEEQQTMSSESSAADVYDFRDQTVYFMMTDRFCDGNTANNNIYGDEYLPGGASQKYWYNEDKTGILSYYHGGDFQGIINNVDYIKEMGFTAIWITPILKQTEGRYFWSGGTYQASPFHGYWAYDFDKVDPHLHNSGTSSDGWNDFQNFCAIMHNNGIRVMVDIVANHGHPTDASSGTKWYAKRNQVVMDGRTWTHTTGDPYKSVSDITRGFFNYIGGYSLADLIDFNERGPNGYDARVHLKNTYKRIIDKGADAFRIDTVAYMTSDFWGEFTDEIQTYAESKGKPGFYQVGEAWVGDRAEAMRHNQDGSKRALHMLDLHGSCMDYPGRMSQVFQGQRGFQEMDLFLASDSELIAPSKLGTFVDNHDSYRVNSILSENQYKNALSYYYLMRGIPIVYYGTEIMYSSWQYLHASTNKEDIVSRWMLGSDGINYVKNNQPVMYKHLKMLNSLRKESIVLRRGEQTKIKYSGNQCIFKRTYGSDVAFIATTNGAGYSYTFTGVPNGNYTLVTPGISTIIKQSVTVTNGTYTVTVQADKFAVLDSSVSGGSVTTTTTVGPTTTTTNGGGGVRSVIFMLKQTVSGQDIFVKGGHDAGLVPSPYPSMSEPITYLNTKNATTVAIKAADASLDWGSESALDWTTNSWPSSWGTKRTYAVDGYGEDPENKWDHHYWKFDVIMDGANGEWYEFKAFMREGSTEWWESDRSQSGTPQSTINHWGKKGYITRCEYNQNWVEFISL